MTHAHLVFSVMIGVDVESPMVATVMSTAPLMKSASPEKMGSLAAGCTESVVGNPANDIARRTINVLGAFNVITVLVSVRIQTPASVTGKVRVK